MRCTGDREGMRLVQEMVIGKTHKKKLSGAVPLDRLPLGAHDHLSGGSIRMVHHLYSIRNILFEEAPKDFCIKVGNRAKDKKELDPIDGDKCIQWIAYRQRMKKGENKKDTNISFKVLPTFIGASGQFV